MSICGIARPIDKVAIFIFLKSTAQAALQIYCRPYDLSLRCTLGKKLCTPAFAPSQVARAGEASQISVAERRGFWPGGNVASDALVQLKCSEDIYCRSFSQGRTMRTARSTVALEFIGQKVHKENGRTSLVATLKHPSGLLCADQLSWGDVPRQPERCLFGRRGSAPIAMPSLAGSAAHANATTLTATTSPFQRELLVHPLFWGEVGDLPA